MNTTLQTKRLVLRPFSPEAIPALHPIFCDERAMRFMPTLPHRSLIETEDWLQAEAARPGAHTWTLHLIANQKSIGYLNFLGGTRFPGMGYIIHPEYWGQGYAPEACQTALDYGFTHLGYDRVELWINQSNAASIRVAEKLNFELKNRIPQKYAHETQHHFMLIYGLLATEWFGTSQTKQPTSLFRVEPVLAVSDVAAAATFYRDKLGFQIDFLFGDPPDHAAVSRGDWTGSTVTIQLTLAPKDYEITPAGYLYVYTDTSLDFLCDSFLKNGVQILTKPQDQPWGMREFVVRDLNGHRIVFGTHI
jgi:RimJ/RimL family protein N-acetyltransferase/uncharacterized glyoxalase superfamily protein PhnB